MRLRTVFGRGLAGLAVLSLVVASTSTLSAQSDLDTLPTLPLIDPGGPDPTSESPEAKPTATEEGNLETPSDESEAGDLKNEPLHAGSVKAPPPLDPALLDLRNRLRKTLAIYHPRHLVAREHSCWEVMHGIIAYGVDAKLFRAGRGGPTANAIGWICYNQPCHGEQLFYLDRGKLVARKGPGLQGHSGQFLAIIAQSHVPSDFPMQVGGKQFTVKDLIELEKSDCRDGEELTFKLIGLAHYLDSDDEWTTRDGQKWNIPRLIREELKQPILRVAACGGNHRLMGHSYAIYKRRKQGKPIDGQFARAEKFISDYHKYAFSLQNPDGSFSTRWFEGRENRPDLDRKIKTTGHTFEWLAFSVPEEKLSDPRMVKAAEFLVNSLAKNVGHQWEVGPHGHALHGLRIYDRRLFKPHDASPSTPESPGPTVTAEPPTASKSQPIEIPKLLNNGSATASQPVQKTVRRQQPAKPIPLPPLNSAPATGAGHGTSLPAPTGSNRSSELPDVPPIEPLSNRSLQR